MRQETLVNVGKYMRQKPNFIRIGGGSVGILSAVGFLWMFGKYGGAGWWMFLIVLALLAGWVWAHFMWLAVGNDIQKLSSDSTGQKTNDNTRE